MARAPKLQLDIATLQAKQHRRVLSSPEPGFFRVRLTKGGPWVPALIWLPCPWIDPIPYEETPAPEDWCLPTDRPRVLRGRIGTRDVDPAEVWERGYTITGREYYWRLGLVEWASHHAPEQPEANPRKRAALERLPSLF